MKPNKTHAIILLKTGGITEDQLEYMNLDDGYIAFKELPRELVKQFIEEASEEFNKQPYDTTLQPHHLFTRKDINIVIQDIGDLQGKGGALIALYLTGSFTGYYLNFFLEGFYKRNNIKLAFERYEGEKYKPILEKVNLD